MKKLFAFLCNERAFSTDGDWQQLAPFGIFAHPLGRQRVDRAAAEAMTSALTAERQKAGNQWRGVPVFIGHPPERGGDPAQRGQKFPRIGAVMDAEVRADGLWGRVSWNKLGAENASEGHFIYPSPTWFFDQNADGSITPVKLDHIGMTNTPNIPGVQPWTNEESDQEPKEEHTMKKEHVARLKAALNLGDDADDEAVCNACESMAAAHGEAKEKAEKAEGEKTAAETAMNEAKTIAANEKTAAETALAEARTAAANEVKAAHAAHAKTLLDIAVNEGRLDPAERATHEAAFEADFSAASNALAALKPKRDTKPLNIDLGGARKSIAAANERADIIQAAVNEVMTSRRCSYAEAYAVVKTDKRYAAVFEAMQQPKA